MCVYKRNWSEWNVRLELNQFSFYVLQSRNTPHTHAGIIRRLQSDEQDSNRIYLNLFKNYVHLDVSWRFGVLFACENIYIWLHRHSCWFFLSRSSIFCLLSFFRPFFLSFTSFCFFRFTHYDGACNNSWAEQIPRKKYFGQITKTSRFDENIRTEKTWLFA